MVWGCFHESGKWLLVSVQNKVNSDCYIKIFQENVLNFLYINKIFLQSNAPAHKAEKTEDFFENNAFILLENWSPQSRDLIIIKKLWHILKMRVSERCPKNLEDSFLIAIEDFEKTPKEYIKNL